MTNAVLASRVRQLAESHAPRTAERRAAAALFAALTTTRSAQAARRALGSFGDPATRAAAAAILDALEQDRAAELAALRALMTEPPRPSERGDGYAS